MDGLRFENLMRSAFRPFLAPLQFVMQPIHISGRHYSASFVGPSHTLLVGFEPGDGQTIVMLQANGSNSIRSFDDPETTPRLSTLNAQYMGLVEGKERAENEAFFGQLQPQDEQERALIKCAKDLRLVLPRYLRL